MTDLGMPFIALSSPRGRVAIAYAISSTSGSRRQPKSARSRQGFGCTSDRHGSTGDLSTSVGIGREATASTPERTAIPSTRRIAGACKSGDRASSRDWPDAPHGAQAHGAPGCCSVRASSASKTTDITRTAKGAEQAAAPECGQTCAADEPDAPCGTAATGSGRGTGRVPGQSMPRSTTSRRSLCGDTIRTTSISPPPRSFLVQSRLLTGRLGV
jgi:hypothetical protein